MLEGLQGQPKFDAFLISAQPLCIVQRMADKFSSSNASECQLLRHTLATLAYRAGKAVRNVPAGFAEFQAGHGTRTPGQILAHMGDLMDWALSIALGKRTWSDSKSLPWEKEVERFFAALKKFDDQLAAQEISQDEAEKLFQGPIADALTHTGQIAILRRMAEGPIKGESFFDAAIEVGRVGAEQTAPKREF